jgi:hypothetical protein
MILVSAASAMLLVSPLAVQAATTTKAPASTSAKASCKGLKGAALKDCRAKLHATAKPAAKAK